MQQLCEDEDDESDESDESDDGKRNDLASKYDALASLNGAVIITGSENEIKRRKLFINKSKSIDNA